MAKLPPPERPRSRRSGSFSPRGRNERWRPHRLAGCRRSCQLDSSCERVGEWGAGQRSAGKRGLGRLRRALPNGLQLPLRSRPPALHSPRLSLGYRAPQHSAACKLERSRPAVSGFHAPRYITRDGEEPAAASARPSARRPPSRAGQPLSLGRGRSLQLSLHLPSQLTPPAVGRPGLRLSGRAVGGAPAIIPWPLRPRSSRSCHFR